MKTVIEMAREAGFMCHEDSFYTNHRYGDCKLELERFAALVRADEREACAKVCDDYDDEYDVHTRQTAEGIAMQIRARGETK